MRQGNLGYLNVEFSNMVISFAANEKRREDHSASQCNTRDASSKKKNAQSKPKVYHQEIMLVCVFKKKAKLVKGQTCDDEKKKDSVTKGRDG